MPAWIQVRIAFVFLTIHVRDLFCLHLFLLPKVIQLSTVDYTYLFKGQRAFQAKVVPGKMAALLSDQNLMFHPFDLQSYFTLSLCLFFLSGFPYLVCLPLDCSVCRGLHRQEERRGERKLSTELGSQKPQRDLFTNAGWSQVAIGLTIRVHVTHFIPPENKAKWCFCFFIPCHQRVWWLYSAKFGFTTAKKQVCVCV